MASVASVTVSRTNKEGARCISSIQEKQVDKGTSSMGCGSTRMGGCLDVRLSAASSSQARPPDPVTSGQGHFREQLL